jgi:hypothetical protein
MAEEVYRIVLTLAFLLQTTAVSLVPLVGNWISLVHLCWLYALYRCD